MWTKLHGWKSKLFSIGGREVLIKVVAQAIPSYTMSVFRLPSTLCHQIRSMIVKYWWGATRSEKCIYWRKWSLLCCPKLQGCMGFRDFTLFNQALLAKQAWRILINPDSMVARILKMKYFHSTNFQDARLGHNPSYMWRSLLWGRGLLLRGLRWRVSRNSQALVFRDPWLLRPHLFKPISIPNQITSLLRVGQLMTAKGE